MQNVIEYLIKERKTISTMESCTGGAIANAITNIPGASEVFMYSAVTYSNDYKVKMGVSASTINKYTVYSEEVAKEMSKVISNYTNSNYGVGVTGKLNRADINNPYGQDNLVYISVYDKNNDTYHTSTVTCTKDTRPKNKELVIEKVVSIMNNIIKE